MGLFLALTIIGMFLVAGIGYSTWRNQQVRNDISRARKRGAALGGKKKLGDLFGRGVSKDKNEASPDNLEKALDAINLTGVSNVESSGSSAMPSRQELSAPRGYERGQNNNPLVPEPRYSGQSDQDFDDYDELPSDEELAAARINHGDSGSEFNKAGVGESSTVAQDNRPAEDTRKEPSYQKPSQIPLDEFGEPLTLEQQARDQHDNAQSEIGKEAATQNHEPSISRDEVEWLNISMSYNGLVSHISAYIGGKTAFSVEQVMPQIKDMESQIGVPIKMHYRSTVGTSWRRLERVAGVDILELMLSLQLADRNGAVTETQLTRFASSVVDIAENVNRTLHWSLDIDSAAEHATALFNTGKKFDLVAIVHLGANSEKGFSGRELKVAATEARMQLNERGAFEYFDRAVDPLRPLFTMTNRYKPGLFNWSTIENERINGLKLFMYLPHIADPKWAYDEMVRVAHSIERRLDGTLVDEQGSVLNKALSSEASDGIEQYAVLMKNYGMKPGGEVALSLIGDF